MKKHEKRAIERAVDYYINQINLASDHDIERGVYCVNGVEKKTRNLAHDAVRLAQLRARRCYVNELEAIDYAKTLINKTDGRI